MKSIVNELENISDEITFPQLYRSVIFDMIVYFWNKTSGVVVHSGPESNRALGYFSKEWVVCNDASTWIRLPAGSSVTLIQEDTR